MKRKYIWLIEIIVWIIVISSALVFFVYQTTIKANSQNTYYIFFDDAAGLVRGSPVRLMGINIGYVRNVKIFDNKVFISFLVTKENVVVPKSATATITFYGLGGSTSLELNPATSSYDMSSAQIIPSKSYRIQDYWNGQELVSNTLINIYGAFGRNIKKEDVPYLKSFVKQSSLIKEITEQTTNANSAQEVIITKLTRKNNPLTNNKNQIEFGINSQKEEQTNE